MTCEWWTIILAAIGGWLVINMALTGVMVLMAYLTSPTLREAILELDDYSTTEERIDKARLLWNSERAEQ
jgi:hypothetical protein